MAQQEGTTSNNQRPQQNPAFLSASLPRVRNDRTLASSLLSQFTSLRIESGWKGNEDVVFDFVDDGDGRGGFGRLRHGVLHGSGSFIRESGVASVLQCADRLSTSVVGLWRCRCVVGNLMPAVTGGLMILVTHIPMNKVPETQSANAAARSNFSVLVRIHDLPEPAAAVPLQSFPVPTLQGNLSICLSANGLAESFS